MHPPYRFKDMNLNSHMMSSRIEQRLFFRNPDIEKIYYLSSIPKELAENSDK